MSVRGTWAGRSLVALVVIGAAVILAMMFRGSHPGEETVRAEPPAAAKVKAPAAASGDQARSVTVTVAPITVQPVQRAVGAVGTFFGYDEVTVMAEVTGLVTKVYHDVGDIVRPGEVLLEIDATDYQLGFEETLRALQLEVARILSPLPPDADFEPERALAILRSLDLNKLPSVVRAKEEEENARLRFDRVKQLFERGSISDEEYQQRSTDYDVALSKLTQAQLDAQAVIAGIKHRLVLLRIAKRKLDLTQVKVPSPTERERRPETVQYAVVEKKVTEGEMVKDTPGSSTAAFELVMDGVLKLRANVPERFVSEVSQGQKAEVHVEAYPDRVFAGDVVRINPMIDRTSRTFEVEVYVDNPNRDLKAGGFAKVDILTRVDPQAWTVPVEAIVTYAGSIKVFVIRDGHAHAVAITPGLEGRGWVELIRSASPDLRQDDQIITSGQEKLAEGVAVSVRGETKVEESKS
jgi:multidrug efflux pump subunit AcrA (membrane-fusion protein)